MRTEFHANPIKVSCAIVIAAATVTATHTAFINRVDNSHKANVEAAKPKKGWFGDVLENFDLGSFLLDDSNTPVLFALLFSLLGGLIFTIYTTSKTIDFFKKIKTENTSNGMFGLLLYTSPKELNDYFIIQQSAGVKTILYEHILKRIASGELTSEYQIDAALAGALQAPNFYETVLASLKMRKTILTKEDIIGGISEFGSNYSAYIRDSARVLAENSHYPAHYDAFTTLDKYYYFLIDTQYCQFMYGVRFLFLTYAFYYACKWLYTRIRKKFFSAVTLDMQVQNTLTAVKESAETLDELKSIMVAAQQSPYVQVVTAPQPRVRKRRARIRWRKARHSRIA